MRGVSRDYLIFKFVPGTPFSTTIPMNNRLRFHQNDHLSSWLQLNRQAVTFPLHADPVFCAQLAQVQRTQARELYRAG